MLAKTDEVLKTVFKSQCSQILSFALGISRKGLEEYSLQIITYIPKLVHI